MPVREATEADVEAIERVAQRSWSVDYPDILTRETAEEGVTEWYDADRVRTELDAGRTLLFVAERDGAVVGFAHATWDADAGADAPREGYVLRVYVTPAHRRAGVGGRLLERCREELEARGVDRVNAMVLAANRPGNRFYEERGFEHADTSETRIGEESFEEHRYVLEV